MRVLSRFSNRAIRELSTSFLMLIRFLQPHGPKKSSFTECLWDILSLLKNAQSPHIQEWCHIRTPAYSNGYPLARGGFPGQVVVSVTRIIIQVIMSWRTVIKVVNNDNKWNIAT